jgi:hypothetical protein
MPQLAEVIALARQIKAAGDIAQIKHIAGRIARGDCADTVRNDADHWITVNSGHGEGGGTPALIGEDGTVKAGMGGKFNGKNIKDAHGTEKFTSGETNKETEARHKSESADEPVTVSKPTGEQHKEFNIPKPELTPAEKAGKHADELSATAKTAQEHTEARNAHVQAANQLGQKHPDWVKQKRATQAITYTFPLDFSVTELRGKTFTGGNLCRVDGDWRREPDAVDFGRQQIGGKTVALKAKIAGKPELEAMLAADKSEKEAIKARLAAIGWPTYQAAQSKAINARGDYDYASERGYPVKEAAAMRVADEALDAVAHEYPLAAVYAKAESYSMAHNDLKASAGTRAMRAIENGADPLQAAAEMDAEWTAAASRAVANN